MFHTDLFDLQEVKILQIIPADQWFANYEYNEVPVGTDPVVCFALVEVSKGDETFRGVRPMAWTGESIGFCGEMENFIDISYREKETA